MNRIIAGRLHELESARDPRRRQRLANELAGQIVRAADRKVRTQKPRPQAVETRQSKWSPLSELRTLLRRRA